MKKIILIGFILLVFFFSSLINVDNGLKDNYYYFINEEVILDNKLEDNEYSWSYFLKAQEKVDENVDLIVNDILDNKVEGLNSKEINTIKSLYDKAIDIDKRNKDGIKDLKPYLDRVWNIDSVDELIDVIILVEKELDIDLISNIEVVQDYKDNSRNIIYFYPITYAFGASSDYMVNDDYMAYKAYVRRACVQLWKVYGYDRSKAREVVNRVFDFYEEIANNSRLDNDLDEIDDYYNIVNESYVNSLFSNIDGKYLERLGISNNNIYSLVDEGQYKYINDSLISDNLEIWKEVIITKILSSYASYGSKDYVEVVDNLSKELLGSNEEINNEEMAKIIVKDLFSSEIDKIYVNKYLDDKQINELEDMFLDIKDIYKIRIKNNKWLSKEAKDKALLKLDKMKFIIGLSDVSSYEIANEFDMSSDSLIKDIIKVKQMVRKDDLERLKNDEKINLINQTQVNAYYQPLDNSVVIPVAFLELISDKTSYYEKLGTLGMILAHEVTHAFDGNGSKFDEFGNLNDWWSKEDKIVFENLKQEVIDYYDKYEVIDGKYVNGERTVNENIADLGSVACIVEIAKNKGASYEELKEMFSSFAKIWASVESDEYMELLLLQDIHAPNQFRVNASLASIDEFYQVYNIYPWNDMWLSKDDRVMVW